MRFKNVKSISKTLFMGMFFFSAISIIIIGLIWIVREYDQFKKESERLRIEYILGQKRIIKSEVIRAVDLVNYDINQTENRLKVSIKNRVYESYEIANHIYNHFRGSKSDSEIKRLIIESLRNIRFNRGRGYYFAADFNGIEQLFADHPELEGKDLSDMQDSQGQFVIRDLIKIAKKPGEGFYRYLWTKPNSEGKNHVKIAFVKHFKPFDWFIGTGEYLEDTKNEIQNEALETLIKIRFGTNGYIFGSTYDGKPLFTNGKITKGASSVWDLTDPNGVKIIQEQRKAVRNIDGGFYRYSWKKLTSSEPSPKLSFTKGISKWQWMIGAGVYMDEIDRIIASKREILNSQIRNQIAKIVLAFLVLTLITYSIAKLISIKTRRTFDRFLTFFNKASSDYVQIDTSDMVFSEFSRLAVLVNRLITDRELSKEALSKSELLLKKIAANYPCYLSVIKEDFTIAFSSGKEFEKQNLSPESFNGLHIEEVFGEKADFIMNQYKKAFQGEGIHFEMEFNNQYQLYTVIPLSSRSGMTDQILSIVENITERKQTEEQIKASLKEKEILLQEIHHRVKNNMQVVTSLLRLQADKDEDPRIKEALRESQGRVYAMSAVHETLYGGENLSEIDLSSYLKKISGTLLQTYSVRSDQVRFHIDSEDIKLSIEKANPLGLVINELISNSLKHAFTNEKVGNIKIHAKRSSNKDMVLTVSDDGKGIRDTMVWNHSNTLGLHLVRSLVETQLDGSIEMENKSGTIFTIVFKI